VRLVRIALLAALCFAVTGSTANALDIETDVQPPPGEVGTPYEFEFEGQEGCVPYRFSYLNGTVPPGLEITTDGKLTGTPTQAGTFSFWVALDDNGGPQNPACIFASPQSQGLFTMIVMPDLAVSTTSLPAATPGKPYSVQLEYTNPEAGWTVVWDITQGSLPTGLHLSESGLISGTPIAPDVKTFVVRAREPFRRFGDRELTLRVAAGLQGSASLNTGEVALPYGGSIIASGGAPPRTYTIASGRLPAGLALDAATGVVRGTPEADGAFTLTFAVTDSAGQRITIPASLRIASQLSIRTARLPSGTVGDPYRARLASSGGLAPTQWRVVRGSLPRGIRLDATTGMLSGRTRAAGASRCTFEVRDRLGARSTKALRLRVAS
jgi:large repetitive protein